MAGFIVTILIGVVCVILGISNYKGNIESLHSYHRKRVSEEDRIPFGRMVGGGTIIIGCGIILCGSLSAVTVFTENKAFMAVGTGIMAVSLVIGLCMSFYAMIKYNKGIF